MNDHRDPQRMEGTAREFRSMGGRSRRERITVHVREIDAAALDYLSICDDPGQAPSSSGPLPIILSQLRGRILAHESIEDSIL
jgi:hypothetical protein